MANSGSNSNNRTDQETSDGSRIGQAQPMYQDQYEDDLSQQPELKVPGMATTPHAPPYDFATSATTYAPRSHGRRYHAPVMNIGIIDDFDFERPELNDAVVTNVAHDADMVHMSYRPRLKDMLFATGVGKPVPRREEQITTAAPSTEPKQPARPQPAPAVPLNTAKQPMYYGDQPNTLRAEQQATEENPHMAAIREAVERAFAEPDHQASEGGVEELEYANLRPRESHYQPEGLYIRSMRDEDLEKQNSSSQPVSRDTTYDEKPPSIHRDPESIGSILNDRQNAQDQITGPVKVEHSQRTPSPISVAAVIAIITIGLLFIWAL